MDDVHDRKPWLFKPGNVANPVGGRKRPIGGRTAALLVLDQIIGKRKNKVVLGEAIQEAFTKDPLGFFKSVIMPLIPKEAKLAVEAESVIEWPGPRNGFEQKIAKDAKGEKDEGGSLAPGWGYLRIRRVGWRR